MKKTFLFLVIFLSAIPVFCQEKSINGRTNKFYYCEIVGTSKIMGKNLTVKIDFGQSKKFLADNRYKDPSTGKPFVFNSIIDALNFMGNEGWEFVQEYTEGEAQTGSIYHFMFKKIAEQLENDDRVHK